MIGTESKISRLAVLKSIFTRPAYIFAAFASAIIYYYIFYYVIIRSNSGLFFITVPAYLVYTLIASAAILLTIGVYSIHLSLKATKPIYGSAAGSATAVIGSVVASCGCTEPIFATILYTFGFNSIAVSSFISTVSRYQSTILMLFILLNLILIYRYTTALSRSCKIDKRSGDLSKK